MSDPLGNVSFDVDVIVIGAGPIGLTVACALGHLGVRTRVFAVSNGVKIDLGLEWALWGGRIGRG